MRKPVIKPYVVFKMRLSMYGEPIDVVEARSQKEAIKKVRDQYGPGTYTASHRRNEQETQSIRDLIQREREAGLRP